MIFTNSTHEVWIMKDQIFGHGGPFCFQQSLQMLFLHSFAWQPKFKERKWKLNLISHLFFFLDSSSLLIISFQIIVWCSDKLTRTSTTSNLSEQKQKNKKKKTLLHLTVKSMHNKDLFTLAVQSPIWDLRILQEVPCLEEMTWKEQVISLAERKELHEQHL